MIDFTLKSINSTYESYQQLIDLYHSNKNRQFQVISISFETWFAANISAALGGILDKLETQVNIIKLRNIPLDIKTIMQKNDFLSYFGFQKLPDTYHTTIKYLKLKPSDSRYFQQYVSNELLDQPKLPKMSKVLKKKITESIYEIFVNAQIHSKSEFIYTCGQFYPKNDIIEFTITDTGIGFKESVNSRFNKNLSSINAIKWATTDGHTTKKGISGGIGLAILKEFINMNKGKIQIISDDGFYQLDKEGEKTKLFKLPFPGTIINLEFRTSDESSYAMSAEVNEDELF